jgi:multisubunit Na+/H+ antiporter MnhB subunit
VPSSATASTSTTTGALIVAGGGYIRGIRTYIYLNGTSLATTLTSYVSSVSPDITGTATMVNITTSGLINTLNIRKSSLGIYAGDGTPWFL